MQRSFQREYHHIRMAADVQLPIVLSSEQHPNRVWGLPYALNEVVPELQGTPCNLLCKDLLDLWDAGRVVRSART